jgi:hypothetical protein
MGQKSRLKKEKKKQGELEKIVKAEPKKSNRKLWPWIVGAAFTFGLAVGGYFILRPEPRPVVKQQIKRISYENARKDKSLRLEYIRQLIKRYKPPVPIKVLYNDSMDHYPNPFADTGGMVTRTRFIAQAGIGVAQNLKIEVYRGAFKETKSEDEFLSTFVDHEYRHVELLAGGKIDVNASVIREFHARIINLEGDLFEIYHELHAYTTQIRSFSKRKNISKEFKDRIIDGYQIYRKELQKKRRTPLTRFLLEEFPAQHPKKNKNLYK